MEKLCFINEKILERIEAGGFVPNRRSKPGSLNLSSPASGAERRDSVSPLAVTKRCVRYDPQVFLNRGDLILEMARCLNQPEKKLVLVAGRQGSGKTSLARGIIEIMGGGPEQLLWFDINIHTDYDEIIHFLLQYINYICDALRPHAGENPFSRPPVPANPSEEPSLERLEELILSVADLPLLLVIDNVEHIVNAEYQIHSQPLKEILNFLLSFPNIKMILLGERLPYADMNPNAAAVQEFKLGGLLEEVVVDLLRTKSHHLDESVVSPSVLRELSRLIQGYPWLLKVLFHLNQKALEVEGASLADFERVLRETGERTGEPAVETITRFIYQRLSPELRAVAHVLCLLRHPADLPTLLALTRFCHPGLPELSGSLDLGALDGSLLKPVMKKTFPPQTVLEHIRLRHERQVAFHPWYELYRPVKKGVAATLPDAERARLHERIQEFYVKERNKPLEERVYPVRSKALAQEARFHGGMARRRRGPGAEEGPLETKPYVYRNAQPVAGEKAWTLEDFRRVQLPDSETTMTSDWSEEQPGGFLEGLQLTEEEKALLGVGSNPATHSGAESSEPMVPRFSDPPPLVTSETLPEDPAVFPMPPNEDEEPLMRLNVQQAPLSSTPSPAGMASGNTTENPAEGPVAKREEPGESPATEDPREREIRERLAQAVANHNKPGMLRQLLDLARYRAGRGLFRAAEACLNKALTLSDAADAELDPGEYRAEAFTLLGGVHKETYRYNSALGLLAEAASLMPDTEAHWERLGQAYQDMGDIHVVREQRGEALREYLKALEYFALRDDKLRQAEVYFKMAQVYDAMGFGENAITYFEQALCLDKTQGNDVSCAAALANIGGIHLEAGRFEQAVIVLRESLTHDRRARNRAGLYKTLDLLARAHLGLHQWEAAEKAHRQALMVALKEGSNPWKASAYMKLGSLYARRRQWEKALAHYQSARDCAPDELSLESRQWLEHKIEEATHVLRNQTHPTGDSPGGTA